MLYARRNQIHELLILLVFCSILSLMTTKSMGFLWGLTAVLLIACQNQPTGLLRPNGVVVATDGTLFVMDRGNYRIVHLDENGRMLHSFGSLGLEAGDIYAGWDIADDDQGHLYINDLNDLFPETAEAAGLPLGSVKKFTAQGDFLQAFDFQTGLEQSPLLSSPYGLEIDQQNRLYVANYGDNLIQVFDTQGQHLVALPLQGSGYGLNDVAVDDTRQWLYATDVINSQIQQFQMVFATGGQLSLVPRLQFGSYGREEGQFAYPSYLAVDENEGWLYVADMGNRRIQVFDQDGRFLRQFAPPDTPVWQVMGLDVAADGAVYAADAYNNVVWVFEPDGRLRRRIQP